MENSTDIQDSIQKGGRLAFTIGMIATLLTVVLGLMDTESILSVLPSGLCPLGGDPFRESGLFDDSAPHRWWLGVYNPS